MRTIILYFLILAGLTSATAQSIDSISTALSIIGLSFDSSEVKMMKANVAQINQSAQFIRKQEISNEVPFSLLFTPALNEDRLQSKQMDIKWESKTDVRLPQNPSDLAFYSITELASLIKQRKISSVQLTQFFLDRLDQYGDTLECIITITDSLALAQAQRADREIAAGHYKGLLHGIPFGVKDLLATKNYKTTWGAEPFKNQHIDEDATVVKKLQEAGAVLVAKLTLGALAYGDVWYGGQTKNPWDLTQGSSGSSAGSTSATIAGLVPFAIGSETLGSIVSPSTVCGATGLRPTYGRVSKHGAMALSWSMDKLGPICRSAEDCAIVFDAIRGEDKKDMTVRNHPFNYDKKLDIKTLRVGYLTNEFLLKNTNVTNDSVTLKTLQDNGIRLIEKSFASTEAENIWSTILCAEAAAAFNDLTLSQKDDLLVSQNPNSWPNIFRASRLIPAVEYIQANRIRHQITMEFNDLMKDIDVLVAPSFGAQLFVTNLTGHPCVVLPNGSYGNNSGGSISLIGNHFDEASILLFANYLQDITAFNSEHPNLFK